MQEDSQHSGSRKRRSPLQATGWWKAPSVEVWGEIILLAIIGGFFLYIIADARGWIGREWPLAAALSPWIFVTMGIPLLLLRLAQLLKIWPFGGARAGGGDPNIMDIGFRIGDDVRAANRRLVGIIGSIATFFLAIWFVGVYIAAPLWVFGYMYWVGRARLPVAAVMGLLLLGLILTYDYLMFPRWHTPLLVELWRDIFG